MGMIYRGVQQMSNRENSIFYTSYIAIRKSIGYLGVLLPFLLVLGGLVFNKGSIEFSLSAYYHNNLGDIFVLVMGASGMLLVAYRGREKIIRGLTTAGGILALLIILFPTEVEGVPAPYGVFNLQPGLSGTLHMIFAIAFFIVLGIISFWRFTDHTEDTEPERLEKDRLYRLFGLTSFICAFLYFLVAIFLRGTMRFYPILIIEIIGLEAMGLTWLIKGSKKS